MRSRQTHWLRNRLILLVFLIGGWLLFRRAYWTSSPKPPPRTPKFPGWKGIHSLFVFGDGYSTSFFDLNGKRPTDQDPLGNDDLFPQQYRATGRYYLRPNWVHFLVTRYNASNVKTYNFAKQGASIDRDAAPSLAGAGIDYNVRQQVEDLFIPNYVDEDDRKAEWSTGSSMFAIFAGLHDIEWLQDKEVTYFPYDDVLSAYTSILHRLYTTGARYFLLVNTPPVGKSKTKDGRTFEQSSPHVHDLILMYNFLLRKMRDDFLKKHKDATLFYFDTYYLYSALLEDPTRHAATQGLKNVVDICDQYMDGTSDLDETRAGCAFPVNQYFWQTTLHPTYPVHQATAASMLEDCFGSERKRYCM